MSFLSRITGRVQDVVPQKAEKLANRFIGDGGFQPMGATFHAPRTNTTEEIIASLKLLAKGEADKAEKGRKYLQELSDEGAYSLERLAKDSSQDIVDVALEMQSRNVEYVKNILRQGGTLSGAQRQEYEELLQIARVAHSIKVAELKTKEITEFLKVAGDMPQRHLSLAHDVVDLSNTHAMINHDIFPTVNFNDIGQAKSTGKRTTLMGYVLNLLPGLSKANPKAVDLAETVVSHSDDTNAKFFLQRFVDGFPFVGTEKQAEATEALVEPLANSILKGMPSMDLGPRSKEQTFFNQIRHLCSEDSKPENLRLLKQTLDTTDSVAPNVDADINLDDIRLGDTVRIKENLEVLPQVLENAEAQGLRTFDVSGFLTKNVNLN
ncbi:hypothetical protein IKL64_03575 [bacterium]|nr:hypothetical protein [bacterium]